MNSSSFLDLPTLLTKQMSVEKRLDGLVFEAERSRAEMKGVKNLSKYLVVREMKI